MSEKMLKFVGIGQQTPPKRSVDNRSKDFNEIQFKDRERASISGFLGLFIHLIVNMGMTVGLLPVTGLPAPFLSYGGSFLLSCILILALSTNIVNHHI